MSIDFSDKGQWPLSIPERPTIQELSSASSGVLGEIQRILSYALEEEPAWPIFYELHGNKKRPIDRRADVGWMQSMQERLKMLPTIAKQLGLWKHLADF